MKVIQKYIVVGMLLLSFLRIDASADNQLKLESPESIEKKLHDAVRFDANRGVENLLHDISTKYQHIKTKLLDSLDGQGFGLLHRAAINNNPTIMEFLLQAGANPDIKVDKDENATKVGNFDIAPGATPLHFVAEGFMNQFDKNGVTGDSDLNKDCFDVLMQYKANPAITNLNGYTLLHVLAMHYNQNWFHFTHTAIKADVNIVNAQTSRGWTALHLLMKDAGDRFSDSDKNKKSSILLMAIELIQAGANPYIKNELQKTSFDYISPLNPEKKALRQLFENGNRKVSVPSQLRLIDPELTEELNVAIRDNEISKVQFLLIDMSIEQLNSLGSLGMGAIHKAAWYDSREIMQLLLEHGANPNLQIVRPENYGYTSFEDDILSHGATPLHIIARGVSGKALSNKECFSLLINYKADLTVKNYNGITLLHVLATCYNENWRYFMKRILKAGVEVNAQTNYMRYTALHLLMFRAKYYFSNPDEKVRDFTISMAQELLVGAKANPNIQDRIGRTPLYHLLVYESKPDVVPIAKLLLSAGADPDIPDKGGETPLNVLSPQNPAKNKLRKLFGIEGVDDADEVDSDQEETSKEEAYKPFEIMPKTDRDAREILGVGLYASPAEIKKAYKKLALKHHPDKGGTAQSFQILGAAFERLMSDYYR